MENNANDYSHIKGWGVDADPTNEPTHPIKKYTGDDHKRINWVRPVQQPVTVEVLHSNERPYITAVFGTSVPPSGLSGAIRRFAFKYSENEYLHWLPLLLADRVNVVEGLVDDLKNGIVPNIYAEKGWRSEAKFNGPGFAKNTLITVAFVAAVVLLMTRKGKKSKR